jgi:hypothetical protein
VVGYELQCLSGSISLVICIQRILHDNWDALSHIRIWRVFGLDKNRALRNGQRSVHPGLGSRPMMRAQSRPATSLRGRDGRQPGGVMDALV